MRYLISCFMVVSFFCYPASAQEREYWGAWVWGEHIPPYRPKNHVYGYAWNFPSREEAKKRALKECNRKLRNYTSSDECFPDEVSFFSTSNPLSNSLNFRKRCAAIGMEYIRGRKNGYGGGFGNTKQEAEYDLIRTFERYGSKVAVELTVCNNQ